jgi:hypothetical protein
MKRKLFTCATNHQETQKMTFAKISAEDLQAAADFLAAKAELEHKPWLGFCEPLNEYRQATYFVRDCEVLRETMDSAMESIRMDPERRKDLAHFYRSKVWEKNEFSRYKDLDLDRTYERALSRIMLAHIRLWEETQTQPFGLLMQLAKE